MSAIRYIFYGGVEGAYQNMDLSNLSFVSPDFGAVVGGYQEGQLVTGFLELSGEAYEIASGGPPELSSFCPEEHPESTSSSSSPASGIITRRISRETSLWRSGARGSRSHP